MHVNIVTCLLAARAVAAAVALPAHDTVALTPRQPGSDMEFDRRDVTPPRNPLEKRKGGGAKGGHGSGGGSSSGGKGGSSSTSSTSNAGGFSKTGSGPPPSHAGSYGGGGKQPYTAGTTSPSSKIVPAVLGAGAASLLLWGVLAWPHGAYNYHYPHDVTFFNQSANENQTKPVDCLCDKQAVCGCEENSDPAFLASLIGNGSYAGLNKTLIQVADIKGTSTLLLNGTLPNGTTATGGAGAPRPGMLWWPVLATLLAALLCSA